MEKSKIEQLIECLRMALAACEAKYTEADIERVALIVFDSMSNPGRSFHNVRHIFDVAENLNSISVLAAIFHDVVYYQVDQGFRDSIAEIARQAVSIENEKIFVKEYKNEIYEKMLVVFGLKVGDELGIYTGLNEFLSSHIALTLLKNLISDDELIKVAALIESTIPFRFNSIEKLEGRLIQLGYSEDVVQDVCEKAVDFSNSDVLNFAEKDPRRFLNNTWNLISETNYSLRRDVDTFTIKDYRIALYKTFLFFNSLDPKSVFSNFKNYPDNSRWEKLNKGATYNVEIGRKYLEVQLISVATIEAIALLTGGDIPMSLIMGDIRRRDQKIIRMEDYLGEPINKKSNLNADLISLFEEGRAQESSFDMKGSPLSAYIYCSVGDDESEKIFQSAKDFFEGKMKPEALLKVYPRKIITQIIKACTQVSSTRRAKLNQLQGTI